MARRGAARGGLDGLPGGAGLNIAHEAVDRHVLHGDGERVALRLLPSDGTRRDVTYAELAERTNRFAHLLERAGIGAGDVVAVLLGRRLDLFVAVLGALKRRCIVSPMFAAFGPEPIRSRLELGHAVALVTTPVLHDRRIAPLRDELPDLRRVFVTGGEDTRPDGTIALDTALAGMSATCTIEPTDAETPALLHFTSGTTGAPKGALHVHGAVATHLVTGQHALDLHEGDVFWCTADPGWVTGISYGVIAPLVCGATLVVDEAELDPARWYTILADEHVDVWYTAPTAVRMLMRAGPDVPGIDRRRPHLRLAASAGEPLGPDAVAWGRDVLGVPFHDDWWQTETGGIMIANHLGMPIRPGSMGRPEPGIDAAIVRCDDEGAPVRDADDRVELLDGAAEGMLALRAGWPSMFRAYLNEPERYAALFASATGDGSGGPADRWYLSGDLVHRDPDGYLWFVARADDVIKTSGHLIGPFEVERVLLQHPAVADAGVYGVPDPIAGALVRAAVVLAPGWVDDEGTRRSILAHARGRLGAALAPRRILITRDLPRTPSGKILRRELRARELGVAED